MQEAVLILKIGRVGDSSRITYYKFDFPGRLWLVQARAVALIASPRSTSIYCCFFFLFILLLRVFQRFMNPLRIAVRHYSAMASTPSSCSPFTRAVVSSMRKLYVFKLEELPRNFLELGIDQHADTRNHWPTKALTILDVSCFSI